MKCPKCRRSKTTVKSTSEYIDGDGPVVVRKRKCKSAACAHRCTTTERPTEE